MRARKNLLPGEGWHTDKPKGELNKATSSKHERQRAMGMPPGPLSLITQVKVLTQPHVLPLAQDHPASAQCPVYFHPPLALLSGSLLITLRPPADPQRLLLAPPPFQPSLLPPEAPPPHTAPSFSFPRAGRRRRTNRAAPQQGSRAAGRGLSFPEPHCLVGLWQVPQA